MTKKHNMARNQDPQLTPSNLIRLLVGGMILVSLIIVISIVVLNLPNDEQIKMLPTLTSLISAGFLAFGWGHPRERH